MPAVALVGLYELLIMIICSSQDPAGFDVALAELAERVGRVAPRLPAAS